MPTRAGTKAEQLSTAEAQRAARFGLRGGSEVAVCIDPRAATQTKASSMPMEA